MGAELGRELKVLMSNQAKSHFGTQVAEVLSGAPHRIVDPNEGPGSQGQYEVDLAFLTRDVTGNSGKTLLAPTLERFYEVIRNAPALRWLQTHAAGSDRPIYREVMGRGVVVTTASGANAGPVAQMAVTGLLALARRLPELLESQRRRVWEPLLGARAPQDLSMQTVMVVGLGPIGLEVARLCKCLGMHVLGVRRIRAATEGVDESLTFDEMRGHLGRADWIVLACPLTETTRGLLDASSLALLPAGARVINVSRGEVIVEAALIDALSAGRVGGAFLDVFVSEPLAAESALWSLPNVMVSPHTAGHTLGHYAEVGKIFLENLVRFRQGRELRNEVRQ